MTAQMKNFLDSTGKAQLSVPGVGPIMALC
jgi:hypothetical protein